MDLGVTLYVKNSVEAVSFYKKAFGMSLGYNAKNEGDSYLHAELMKDGKTIFAVSESSDENIARAILNAQWPTMSLGVNLDDEDEMKAAYAMLIEGGRILRPLGPLPWTPLSADVVDRYGVCWYLYVSQHRPEVRGLNS